MVNITEKGNGMIIVTESFLSMPYIRMERQKNR